MANSTTILSNRCVVPAVRALRETAYGVGTRYATAGTGEPIILVHGGGPGASGLTNWSNLIPVLAQHFTVYAIDLIGYGESDKPIVEYSLQTFVEHIAGFVDTLGLSDIRIMGSSQGAYVAIKYVLDHPGRAKSAALIGSGNIATACGLETKEQTATRTDKFVKHFDEGTRDSVRAFMSMIINDPAKVTDELVEARYKAIQAPGHQHMLDSLKRYRKLCAEDSSFMQQRFLREHLKALTIPCCFLWGEDDRTAPLDPLGLALKDMLPQIPFHIIRNSGHQVQNDQPEISNRILLDHFLKR